MSFIILFTQYIHQEFILLYPIVLLTGLLWICFVLPMIYHWKLKFITRFFVLQKAGMNDQKGETRK